MISHLQKVLTSLEKWREEKIFLRKNSKELKIDPFRELTFAGNRRPSTFSLWYIFNFGIWHQKEIPCTEPHWCKFSS